MPQHSLSDLVSEVTSVKVGLVLKLLNPRLNFSYFLVMLLWLFICHARMMFDEMLVRGKEL
jgi:hypothetical protein